MEMICPFPITWAQSCPPFINIAAQMGSKALGRPRISSAIVTTIMEIGHSQGFKTSQHSPKIFPRNKPFYMISSSSTNWKYRSILHTSPGPGSFPKYLCHEFQLIKSFPRYNIAWKKKLVKWVYDPLAKLHSLGKNLNLSSGQSEIINV